MAQPNSIPATPSRRPARDLIDAVLENMRTNLEPLKYSTLAPSRYVVYLHPEEYARIEGIIPVLQEQTSRALDEALQNLNNPPVYRRYFDRLAGSAPPVENAAREWQVEFHPDADGELAPGDILIHSELMLPGTLGRSRRRSAHAADHHRSRRATHDEAGRNGQPNRRRASSARSCPAALRGQRADPIPSTSFATRS